MGLSDQSWKMDRPIGIRENQLIDEHERAMKSDAQYGKMREKLARRAFRESARGRNPSNYLQGLAALEKSPSAFRAGITTAGAGLQDEHTRWDSARAQLRSRMGPGNPGAQPGYVPTNGNLAPPSSPLGQQSQQAQAGQQQAQQQGSGSSPLLDRVSMFRNNLLNLQESWNGAGYTPGDVKEDPRASKYWDSTAQADKPLTEEQYMAGMNDDPNQQRIGETRLTRDIRLMRERQTINDSIPKATPVDLVTEFETARNLYQNGNTEPNSRYLPEYRDEMNRLRELATPQQRALMDSISLSGRRPEEKIRQGTYTGTRPAQVEEYHNLVNRSRLSVDDPNYLADGAKKAENLYKGLNSQDQTNITAGVLKKEGALLRRQREAEEKLIAEQRKKKIQKGS